MLAVQFRTEGVTEELIEGVADFDRKVRAQARETTVPGSRSSLSKKSKGKRAAAAATTDSVVNLDIDKAPREEEVAYSVEEYVDQDEEEEDDVSRGRSVRRDLFSDLRGRSVSPRIYELMGRALAQYLQ